MHSRDLLFYVVLFLSFMLLMGVGHAQNFQIEEWCNDERFSQDFDVGSGGTLEIDIRCEGLWYINVFLFVDYDPAFDLRVESHYKLSFDAIGLLYGESTFDVTTNNIAKRTLRIESRSGEVVELEYKLKE